MTERTVLISGAAGGIGRGLALTLARQGWAVALTGRGAVETNVGRTADEIVAGGGRGLALPADLSRPEQAEGLVGEVLRRWGQIDALINCVGSYHRVPLLEESVEGWQAMFDDNLHPVFYLARLVAPSMQQRHWGRIVNFSIAGAHQLAGQPQITAHYIAKVGVLLLTRALARQLAPDGITANAISPGFVDSTVDGDPALRAKVDKIPAGRLGTVDDVTGAVSFLLSDEARYINGAELQISGGWGA